MDSIHMGTQVPQCLAILLHQVPRRASEVHVGSLISESLMRNGSVSVLGPCCFPAIQQHWLPSRHLSTGDLHLVSPGKEGRRCEVMSLSTCSYSSPCQAGPQSSALLKAFVFDHYRLGFRHQNWALYLPLHENCSYKKCQSHSDIFIRKSLRKAKEKKGIKCF